MKKTLELRNLWAEPARYDISILLPTRGRKELLQRSLASLFSTASNPRSVELLLGVDNDDTDTVNWFKENIIPDLKSYKVDTVVVEFVPLGYEKLNEYLNKLAGIASGKWLFFWNDDAVMETNHWDEKIKSFNDQFVVQRVKTHNEHPYAIFPIVPRDWFYLLGHLSEHQLNDAAISQIAYMVDIMKTVDIHVVHDRADLTGNNKDKTFEQRKIFEGNHLDPRDFNYEELRQRRVMDANKISWYLDRIGQSSDWFKKVMTGEQDPWEKMLSKENDPNSQVRIFN